MPARSEVPVVYRSAAAKEDENKGGGERRGYEPYLAKEDGLLVGAAMTTKGGVEAGLP